MLFKNLCVLVLWTKVASAFRGLNLFDTEGNSDCATQEPCVPGLIFALHNGSLTPTSRKATPIMQLRDELRLISQSEDSLKQ